MGLPRKSASLKPSSNLPRRYGQGHGGDEEEGSREGHEGDEEDGSHEGHEGDEEESGHEGHEGDEEEGGHEGHEGDEEEVPMDPGNLKGAQGLEDHWLLRHQEGHTAVCQGKGALQPVSAALPHVRMELQVWGFPQLWSASSTGFCQLQ